MAAIGAPAMARATVALMMLSSLPVYAAQPIRLQVIPYRGEGSEETQGSKSHDFQWIFRAPPPLVPPLVPEVKKPKTRRPNSGRDWGRRNDFDWLMD